jgi:hypothetical protein
MKRIVLPLLAVATLVSGCGHPLIPAADIPTARTAVQDRAPAEVTAYARPVLGVNLYALANLPAATIRADGQRTLSYIKNVLKAGAVSIAWNFYVHAKTSDAVLSTRNTLSAANVRILTALARGDGLRVQYRPLIFILHGHAAPSWEGPIRPGDPARWFTSYYHAELPYLKVAQQQHVAAFVAATELATLNSSPLWPSFFSRVAAVYHGKVSYSAWDGDYFPPASKLLGVHALGMDMYEPLRKLPASASTGQVTAAWEQYFSGVPSSVRERTTIEETGIEARSGAYQDPPTLGAPGKLDADVQANWFTAACRTVARYHLAGVYFWKVDLTDNPVEHPASSLSTFEGRKGAKAIAACSALFR